MTSAHATAELPLTGVTVLALEHAIAAPLATRHLADQGARVIKVERPDSGDFARGYDTRARGLSSHFVWVNRGKESLALDLKSPLAMSVIARLLERCDVLVQNLAPGATTRLGLDYASLAPRYPRLIVCDISGYGDTGPYAGKKAYDLLVQSESGLLSVTGSAEQAAKCGISIADISAGMYAYSSILAALLSRARTGRGRRIDITMLDCMAEWMGFPLYYGMDGQTPPPRSGASHATIHPYGAYRCGTQTDADTLMLGLQNEREWQLFCKQVLGDAALAQDPRFRDNSARHQHQLALRELIETRFGALGAQQAQARLDEAGIANARVNDVAGLWAHPQLQARQRWQTVASPVGELPALLPPGSDAQHPPSMRPVPRLGEHSQALLCELGFGAAEVAELLHPHQSSPQAASQAKAQAERPTLPPSTTLPAAYAVCDSVDH